MFSRKHKVARKTCSSTFTASKTILLKIFWFLTVFNFSKMLTSAIREWTKQFANTSVRQLPHSVAIYFCTTNKSTMYIGFLPAFILSKGRAKFSSCILLLPKQFFSCLAVVARFVVLEGDHQTCTLKNWRQRFSFFIEHSSRLLVLKHFTTYDYCYTFPIRFSARRTVATSLTSVSLLCI